ncbi:hypothetical protein SAMN05446037_100848 [Anaerovirgula multivorans]|uniref:Helix-turn-helix domain-containing protein n=1 Tax=Anaerovirgula multivorans TaxID=312168 RepID=A0A239DNP4_9FIRM|nr:hypothetical protein [Anaerovirgula multivorans]SNS33711.1 hypothetical protein SAMN05446037_100848 [Anaerovirgula multivorans]
MKKNRKNQYNIKSRKSIDMELQDFLEMNYEGVSQLEIARELGMNSNYVEKIIEEIERDH